LRIADCGLNVNSQFARTLHPARCTPHLHPVLLHQPPVCLHQHPVRDEHRGEPARHGQLGPDDGAVAEAEEQDAEHGQRRPLAAIGQPLASQLEHGDQQAAGDDPPDRRHQQRRNRLERDADPEIRRPPNQADGDPAKIRPGIVVGVRLCDRADSVTG